MIAASASLTPLDRFTHKFQGLDQRLTGVEPARVVTEVLG